MTIQVATNVLPTPMTKETELAPNAKETVDNANLGIYLPVHLAGEDIL